MPVDLQTILVFGGSGSLGSQLTKDLLYKGHKVVVVSRNEHKQWALGNSLDGYLTNNMLQLVVGDIRNIPALYSKIDYVVNCAAMKHVKICGDNPGEAFDINVHGNNNVIDWCIKNKVKKSIYIGTDKAVNPINFYGWTKLIAERNWINANWQATEDKGIFEVVRFGNLLFSSGSVGELFANQQSNVFKISSLESRRYCLTLKQASEIIQRRLFHGDAFGTRQGVTYDHYRKFRVSDLVYACCDKPTIEIAGLRDGEKTEEEFETYFDSQYLTIEELRGLVEEYRKERK